MILKQRFADGRTAYTDIGDQFLYIQQAATEFKELAAEFIRSPEMEKECTGLIQHGKRQIEPIYVDFPQWIHSNNGQLFMDLTSPFYRNETQKANKTEQRKPNRFELQAILHKMDFYRNESGFIAPVWGSELTFFAEKPSFGGTPITRGEVLKLIYES